MENNNSSMSTLNIFGSCVSRDVLEIQQERRIVLQNYIARQSIASAISRPVPIKLEWLDLDSNFQKNMVLHDFKKDAFELFEKNHTDFILVDLIEERFPLARINDSYVTYSNELMASGYIQEPQLLKWHKKKNFMRWLGKMKKNKWEIGKIDADRIINEFGKRLLEIYLPRQIIIHEVYLSDRYINSEKRTCLFSENCLQYNRRINEQYEYAYYRLKKCIPGVQTINCSREYMADESHKWGLSPMHFQKEYYKVVLGEINKIAAINSHR